jgi:hypothetical protein
LDQPSPKISNEYLFLNESSDQWVRSYVESRGFGHISAEKRAESLEKTRNSRAQKRVQNLQNLLQGVDLDIGTFGKIYCHYLVFQLPTKVPRAYGLKSGHKVRVNSDRTVGQRHPFVFTDLARDEDKAREIGLKIKGTTEIDKSPWGTWITHQKGE